jgi:hypothetical protein
LNTSMKAKSVSQRLPRFLSVVLMISLCYGVLAQTDAHRVRNIVLVHGAWADGSGWKGVYGILVKDGLNSVSFKSQRHRSRTMSLLPNAFWLCGMGRAFS